MDTGIEYAVVESSSHGLRLARLADVEYDVAVLTNVTSEHLELHGTLEQYRLDKAKLFAMLGRSVEMGVGKTGVVNADDPHADLYLRATAGRTLTYGTYRHADVVAERVVQSADGLRFNVSHDGSDPAPATLPMLGPFNVQRAGRSLRRAGAGRALADGLDALARFEGVPGRMQRVDEGQPFGVVVDYATRQSRSRRRSARSDLLTLGRLIVVFGSAGERDSEATGDGPRRRSSRRRALSDQRGPRCEDERQILREIAAGAQPNRTPTLIPSRREAIYEAFRSAVPGDMILLAGKGHESSIERRRPYRTLVEVEVARELLRLL
ncbi:MAG: Mur ligase family protein [Chloroflexia bacterium]